MTSYNSVLCGSSVLSLSLALQALMACCRRKQAPQSQGQAVKQSGVLRTGDISKFFSFCGLAHPCLFSGLQL